MNKPMNYRSEVEKVLGHIPDHDEEFCGCPELATKLLALTEKLFAEAMPKKKKYYIGSGAVIEAGIGGYNQALQDLKHNLQEALKKASRI